ncbi:hypothetical protein Ahy_A08g039631 [Arachis hypogaea]|uniref:DUF4283 domain-containing protein n=1 Tax=Arachis hypogaea TaxID=3818 RepID=A0A445BXB0_ARAHY|nr:hypothetical protein Ahy_A08g039631 [Arachis hypogaea]
MECSFNGEKSLKRKSRLHSWSNVFIIEIGYKSRLLPGALFRIRRLSSCSPWISMDNSWALPDRSTLKAFFPILGKISNLPIESYNHHFLWRVDSVISHMLKIDQTTFIYSKRRLVWICILVPKISILSNNLNIKYEGLHLICFLCDKYDHKTELCFKVIVTKIQQSNLVAASS